MTTKAKTIADFRNAHDKDVIIPRKIRAALEAMLKVGVENWEYESDFVKLAGISQTDVTRYRGEFLKHIVVAPSTHSRTSKRNVWFASVKIAAQLRGE